MSSETSTISMPRRLAEAHRPFGGCAVWRYYDPATGQFISVDPVVDQTIEPYEYAGDDPVDTVDPSGQCALGWFNGARGMSELANGVVHLPVPIPVPGPRKKSTTPEPAAQPPKASVVVSPVEVVGLVAQTDAIVSCADCDSLSATISVNESLPREFSGSKLIFPEARSGKIVHPGTPNTATMRVEAFGGAGDEAWIEVRDYEWGEDGVLHEGSRSSRSA